MTTDREQTDCSQLTLTHLLAVIWIAVTSLGASVTEQIFFSVVLRRRSRKSVRTHLVREHRSPTRGSSNPPGRGRGVSNVADEPTQSSEADPPPVINVEDVIIVEPPEFIEENQENFSDEDGPPPVSF